LVVGVLCFLEALSAPIAQGKTLALLVGVTEYPSLKNYPFYDSRIHLRGPINDAREFKKLLIDKFGLEEGSITLLIEGLKDTYRPTRANIEREFNRLAEVAQKGDIIVILMSGHGDQLPARNDDPDNVEPDGWDEVFLPADVTCWKPQSRIDNAITDNNFRKWLGAIEGKGAFVWIIFDACHSYSLARGYSDEQPRSLGRDILIPRELREEAEAQARSAVRLPLEQDKGGVSGPEGIADGVATMKRTFAMYAALANEQAPELGQPRHGLLTYTIIKVLNECGRRITYSELLDRVLSDYRATRLNREPTPCAEGAFGLQVLGLRQWPQRSNILLTDKAGDWEVTAGTLMGLTQGSILAVYPPVEETRNNVAIGFAKVLEAGPTNAKVTPCDREGERASFKLTSEPAQARCEIIKHRFGDMGLKVACRVATATPGESQDGTSGAERLDLIASEPELPAPLKEALASIQGEVGELIAFTPKLKEAQWVLDVRGDRCRLSNITGVVVDEHQTRGRSISSTSYGPFDMSNGARLTMQLLRHFESIYKWQNLLRIGGDGGPLASDDADTALGVKFYTCDDPVGTNRHEVTGDTLRVGKYLDIQLRNMGRRNLSVTVLYLDEDYGVVPLFPRGRQGNLIEANLNGTARPISIKWNNKLIPIEKPNRMREHLVVIAVPNQDRQRPTDFSFLAQPSLERAKGRGGASEALDTPLGRLLALAAFGGKEATRGGSLFLPADPEAKAVFYLKSWRAVGAQVPERFGPKAEIRITAENLNNVISGSAKEKWMPRASDEKPRGLGSDLFSKVAPAVVVVRTSDGHGTGFLLRDTRFGKGCILTNYHVVRSGTTLDALRQGSVAQIHVGHMGDDGLMRHQENALPAVVLAVDERRDLALLKLVDKPKNIEGMSTIPLADHPPRPGQACAIIGHPSSGMLWTYRSCEVAQVGKSPDDLMDVIMHRLAASRIDRNRLEEQLTRIPSRKIIMTSCQANPGDSGGPVVNKDGELIAITFAIPAEQAEAKFSYHVHIDEVKAFLDEANRTPLILVPDAWNLGPNVEVVDLFDTGRPQAIVSGWQGPQQVMIDLDEDTELSVFATKKLNALKEGFDAEFALHMRPENVVAFYDRDNDGNFDLILFDEDRDQYADSRCVLGSEGRWSVKGVKKGVNSQPMVDASLFPKNSKIARSMMRLDKHLFATGDVNGGGGGW